jgi:hypothetical protein
LRILSSSRNHAAIAREIAAPGAANAKRADAAEPAGAAVLYKARRIGSRASPLARIPIEKALSISCRIRSRALSDRTESSSR